jgi:hypothetical protein
LLTISNTKDKESSAKRARASDSVSLSPRNKKMPPQPPVITRPPQSHPTFVNFSVPINTPPSAIRSTIQAYNPPPFPLESIDQLIHFSIIPRNDHFKQAHIKVLDGNATNTICNFFTVLDNNSYPHPSTSHPPTGTCPTDIDTSPPLNLSFPTNCRVIGCMLHNLGTETNNTNATENEIQNLETHGHTYHSDLLNSLPSHTLSYKLAQMQTTMPTHSLHNSPPPKPPAILHNVPHNKNCNNYGIFAQPHIDNS